MPPPGIHRSHFVQGRPVSSPSIQPNHMHPMAINNQEKEIAASPRSSDVRAEISPVSRPCTPNAIPKAGGVLARATRKAFPRNIRIRPRMLRRRSKVSSRMSTVSDSNSILDFPFKTARAPRLPPPLSGATPDDSPILPAPQRCLWEMQSPNNQSSQNSVVRPGWKLRLQCRGRRLTCLSSGVTSVPLHICRTG